MSWVVDTSQIQLKCKIHVNNVRVNINVELPLVASINTIKFSSLGELTNIVKLRCEDISVNSGDITHYDYMCCCSNL